MITSSVVVDLPADAKTWRDIANQLPADLVTQLKRADELEAKSIRPWECAQGDSDAIMTAFQINDRIARHQAGVRFADVPLPAVDRIQADEWFNIGTPDNEEWTRSLSGPSFPIDNTIGPVLVEGTQTTDEDVEWGLRVDDDVDYLNAAQARLLAAALLNAADTLDNITA